MSQYIAYVTLMVKDYDEAIDFYTRVLGFQLIDDTQLSLEKRWVLISPQSTGTTCLLLSKAANQAQMEHIGNQTGGRVFMFLHTDDFWRDYDEMRNRGVHFTELPRQESYGTVAVFKDLYGNRWDLLELCR
jgi:lactoylglutathione lyase